MPNSAPNDALELAHDLILRIERLATTSDSASDALEDELTDHRGCLADITERLMTGDLDEARARAEALEAVQTHIRHLREIHRDHEA